MFYPQNPSLALRMGSKGFFQNMVMFSSISNKMESQMQQHVGKYFARRPPKAKGQNSTSSEVQNMVMLQIKWNRDCSNMQAHFLSLHTCLNPEWGQTHLFLKVVIWHIKLRGMKNRLT